MPELAGEVGRDRMQELAGAGGRSQGRTGISRSQACGRRQEPGKGRYQQEPPLQGIFMLT
jgi:hypothetical protein